MNYVITDTITKDVYTAKSIEEAYDALTYILGGQELTSYEDESLSELLYDLSYNDVSDVFDFTESLGILVVVTR